LTEQDIEDGVGLEEHHDVGQEEKDDVEEEVIEEEELVSNEDMVHSVIVLPPQRSV
jgi:hypothetical protein